MRLKTLIKEFRFEEKNRGRITLGTDTRLHPTLNRLQLMGASELGDADFPTTADLNARTWVTDPRNVKQWIGFQVDKVLPKVDNQVVTSLGYRLSDGTDEFWWDGGAWAVSTSNWNTEAEVSENIGDFAVPPRTFQVVINLRTTDATVTPTVSAIRVAYKSDIEFHEDIIFRSLVPTLRDSIRPIADFPIVLIEDTDTLDLENVYKLETPYNIADIDAVYNHSDDPDHTIDLLQSWNPGTKVVTLSAVLAADKVAWVRFEYEAEVAVSTSQDYIEVEKVPAMVLEAIEVVNASQQGQDNWVLNSHNGEGIVLPPPIRGDLEVTMNLLTDKDTDLSRMTDEVKRWALEDAVLRSVGLDEDYSIIIDDKFASLTRANKQEVRSARMRVIIKNVLFFVKAAVAAYAIQRFRLEGDMDTVVQ